MSAFLSDSFRNTHRSRYGSDMAARRAALRAQGTDPDSLTNAQVAGLAGTRALMAQQRAERDGRLGEPFRQLDGRGWQRKDSRNGWVHASGPADPTEVLVGYPNGYDSRCGWCYLGAGHTQAAHRKSVDRNREGWSR